MFNNSTNISKAKYHHSPQIILRRMTLYIQVQTCERHKQVNWTPSHYLILGSPTSVMLYTETMHNDHTLSQNLITTYSSCLEYSDLHFTRRYVCSLSSLIIVIGEESSRDSHQKHALSSCICRLSTCLFVEIVIQLDTHKYLLCRTHTLYKRRKLNIRFCL